MCSSSLLVADKHLDTRQGGSTVVSGSVCSGSVRESEVSVCVGGREERWRSTHRPPFEMVMLSSRK